MKQFIKHIGERFYSEIMDQGYITGGHNGPYHDPETPVRNTAHWLFTFSYLYKTTGDNRYKEAVKRCARYLISKTARPHGFSFYHRDKEGKNKCNGLIGQAWTIEALVEAAHILNNDEYSKVATEVFSQHHFNQDHGLWNQLEIDGTILPIDPTFNHQLWFTASASLLDFEKSPAIRAKLNKFMDNLEKNMTVLQNGLIYHIIERPFVDPYFTRNKFAGLMLKTRKGLKYRIKRLFMKHRNAKSGVGYVSIGYHSFNMYAFALLMNRFPNHSFWNSEKFTKMMKYIHCDEYTRSLSENKYGYPYNPPGFEIPFAISVFGNLPESELLAKIAYWIKQQVKRCYNRETSLFDRNTEDALTLTARLYEVTRLPKEILERLEISSGTMD